MRDYLRVGFNILITPLFIMSGILLVAYANFRRWYFGTAREVEYESEIYWFLRSLSNCEAGDRIRISRSDALKFPPSPGTSSGVLLEKVLRLGYIAEEEGELKLTELGMEFVASFRQPSPAGGVRDH